LVGYPEDELLARTFQEITHPDDLQADLDCVRQIIQGEIGSYQMEKRYVHRLGHLIEVSLDVSLVRDSQGQPLYFISQIQDITARKQAEADLRQSAEEFRILAEAMPQIIWVTRPDGWHTHFNQRWMDYTGLSLEESLGAVGCHHFTPKISPSPRSVGSTRNVTGEPYEIEYRLRRADGAYRWMLGRALPLRMKRRRDREMVLGPARTSTI
jgi:PAS domain S-box-containing protein